MEKLQPSVKCTKCKAQVSLLPWPLGEPFELFGGTALYVLCTLYSWVVVYLKDPLALDIEVRYTAEARRQPASSGKPPCTKGRLFSPRKISWVHPNKLQPKHTGRSGFRWAASLQSHVCFYFFLINTSNPHSLQKFFKLQINKPKKINIIPNTAINTAHTWVLIIIKANVYSLLGLG